MSQTRSQPVQSQPQEEHILVVKRSDLFKEESWQGINAACVDDYIERIKSHHTFLPRSLMENDPTYKQIIPYIIYTYGDRYFLMQRKSTAGEQRLKNKMSLGIGGHMRSEDMEGSDVISWAMREFHEEVSYDGTFSVKILGFLNDDSNPVGQVHIGLVMLFQGTSENIAIKSEHKNGMLVTLSECQNFYDALEPWSQLVFNELIIHS